MQNGREIDKVIATQILGHEVRFEKNGAMRETLPNGQTRPLRPYSTDISAAWEIANKIGVTLLPTTEGWFALIGREPKWESPAAFIQYLGEGTFVKSGAAVAEHGSMAICLAAVRWLQGQNAAEQASAESDVSEDAQSSASDEPNAEALPPPTPIRPRELH